MAGDGVLELEGARVDLGTGRVQRADGVEARLGPTERALLRYLVDHPDRDLPRRELLAEVWGYRPTTSSRTLDTTVKTLRRKVEVDAADPDHVRTAWGTGYRFAPVAARAPDDPDPLVGRDAELADLDRAVLEARLVTILGPGGAGKTRLARHLVARRADARFVDLRYATDRRDVVEAVADPEQDGLLVLDNAEQVVGAVRDLVADWLTRAPDLRILATSRVRLGVPDERVLRLGPLDEAAAAELFRRRAERVRVGACAGQDQGVARIAALAERLPLGLELAAARVVLLSPTELASRLAAHPDLMRRSGDPRHGSLEAVVGWSWALLDPDQREVLARCSVFAGPFGVADAEVVVGLPGVLGHLEALHDASLVSAGDRLVLPDAVRRFAEAHLAEPVPVWVRHAEHTVGRLEGRPPGELDRDQLRAILRRPLGRPDLATRAALLYDRALASTGPFDARLQVLDRAVAEAPDPELRAMALLARARAREQAGADGVDHDLEEARRTAGSEGLRGHAIARLGTRRLTQGRLDDAATLCAEALAVHRAVGDRAGEADGVSNLAFVQVARGDQERAIRGLLEALALQQAVGNRVHAAKVMGMLGNAHNELGRPEVAEQWYRRAQSEHEAAGHLPGVLRMTANLGMIALILDRAADAAELYRRVVADAVDLGEPLVEAIARGNLARCALVLGDLQQAEEEAARSVQQAAALGARKYQGIALLCAGLVARELGDRVRAREVLSDAARISFEVGDGRMEAYALGYRAELVADPTPDLVRAADLMDRVQDEAGRVFVAILRARCAGQPLPAVDPVWIARSEDVRWVLSPRPAR